MLGGNSLYHISQPSAHETGTYHGPPDNGFHAGALQQDTAQALPSQEARSADRLHRIYADFAHDLPQIDAWKDIGHHGKDFVRQLLQIDDTKRMTAEEALQHPWLSNETYGKSLQDAYERAIAGWRPGAAGKGIIQQIRRDPGVSEERDRKMLRLEPGVPVCEGRYFEAADVDPRKQVVTGNTPMKENFRVVSRRSAGSRGMSGSLAA